MCPKLSIFKALICSFPFYTGLPLFQGVSHDLSCCPISFPAVPESVWATHCHLASSNQCFAVRRKLTIMNADNWGEVARVDL